MSKRFFDSDDGMSTIVSRRQRKADQFVSQATENGQDLGKMATSDIYI